MTDLTPFDRRASCVKCGCVRVDFKYRIGNDEDGNLCGFLMVTCSECGYQWKMETMDAPAR